jgi:capsular polysaccharide biosynthesis protein
MEQIQPVLSDFQIEQYALSELSVEEQAQLFAEAEVVVAPHGAGLANLVFSHETTIVELFGSKKSTSYQRLAQITGNKYFFLTSQQAGVDVRVDPDGLRRLLSDIFNFV